jgi:hypothetical protein
LAGRLRVEETKLLVDRESPASFVNRDDGFIRAQSPIDSMCPNDIFKILALLLSTPPEDQSAAENLPSTGKLRIF